jgi:SAM-dependent methyltransferase
MLLREFHRVLRPGGLLLVGELGRDAFEAWDTDIPAHASAPQIHRGLAIVREAINAQGVMLDVIPSIPNWLEPDSTLWAQSSVRENLASSTPPFGSSPQMTVSGVRKRGFCGIVERVAHIPNGKWPSDPVLRLVGALAQSMWKETWLSVVPLLLERGISPDEVRQIVEGAIQELSDPSVRTVWKYTMIHCFKI